MPDALFDFVTSLLSADEPPPGVTLPDADSILDLGNAGGVLVKRASGTVTKSTAWSKFGGKSFRFDGGGAIRHTRNPRAGAFGSNPFCIEGWLNADTSQPSGVNAHFFGIYDEGTLGWGPNALTISADPKSGAPRFALRVWNYSTTAFLLQGTTNPITAGPLHFAITRDASDVWRLFVNGALENSATWAGSVNTASTAKVLSLGGVGGGSDGELNGYIDDFRVTIGDPRYTAAFSVPTAAFDYVRGSRQIPDSVKRQLPLPGIPSQLGHRKLLALPIRRDAIFLGVGVVSGTVKEKASPANVPLVRKVLLLDESTNLIMRETWSEPITGNYAFTHLPLGRRYTVISYDYTLNYRAVVADNLEPALA